MDLSIAIFVLLTSYLVGSISFSRLVTRLVAPSQEMADIEVPVPGSDEMYRVTSTGAAAASMTLGGKVGCLIGFLDMLKAAIPTLVFKLLYPEQPYFLIAAVAVMAGHNWPLFHGFKGGRGVSAVYGSLFVVDWIAVPITSIAGLLFGFLIVRDYMIGYLSGLWFIIPWMWLRTHDPAYVAYAVALNILFVLASIPDYKQYVAYRRTGKIDTRDVLLTTPMGRGMLKMGEMVARIVRRGGQS